ncbi:MAG: sulfate/molybdate ABC transporter ATP-binding protein [Caulobacter sp.]|nr:sulfate/molybdate ABC transporter ATP-binding protein [Caulobacter sp.]
MSISVRSVEKMFGRFPALNDVSLDIAPGELLALLGPSGSGKTTLLRAIAGLVFPDSGQILFDGEDMTRVGAADRRVGFVFQQYALFRHMSVARNVAFGLDVRRGEGRPLRAEIDARVGELLDLVELSGLADRYPGQLSGGQQQRVALARALAVSPRVLLLDEPFGALDANVRKTLRRELRRIHDATGVTTVLVTHDQDEALELADRVAVLNQGRIEQVGPPATVYENPVNAFVCGFVGNANRIAGWVRSGQFSTGALGLAAPDVPDGPATAFVRPYDLQLGDAGFATRIERISLDGALAHVALVTVEGMALDAQVSRDQGRTLVAGTAISVMARRAHVFPADRTGHAEA